MKGSFHFDIESRAGGVLGKFQATVLPSSTLHRQKKKNKTKTLAPVASAR